ncbi:MAG: hypothetical protein P8R32_00215 [Candidatus Poseidoniia archaeon]|nr:hypothetical protein [Candidatus Poseidoniia archaeon]
MEIENYWKLVIGITFGVCMLVFGSVFWNTATEDYYNKLNGETYEIDSCLQYMEPPLSSMEERDDCTQKRQLGGVFTAIGVVSLWATIYINKDYIMHLLKQNNLL